MDELLFKTVILIIFSVLRLVIALPLLATARRNHLTNLYWLVAQFLALVVAVPFAAAGALDNVWVFWPFISISEIALIMFIQTTFYQGRRSLTPLWLGLAVLGFIGGLYGNIVGNFEFSAWSVYPLAILIWGWHFAAALSAYRRIASDRFTEDWVKGRYKLMIIYSIFDLISAVLGTGSTTGLWVHPVGALITVAINFASVTVQILTWVMPEVFRKWLNRNYQFPAELQ